MKTQKRYSTAPSRVIFRDAFLCIDENSPDSARQLIEVKTENSLSRITAAANPRPVERVLPGVKFGMEIILNIFDEDLEKDEKADPLDDFQNDAQRILGYTLIGLNLLQQDYLGGNGTRGSGAVKFEITDYLIRTADDYLKNETCSLC